MNEVNTQPADRPRKFRKKPVIVEAEQFHADRPLPFRDRGPLILRYGGRFCVTTIHDQVAPLDDGDWVILEPRGSFKAYPCKPDIFAATYEPVEDVSIATQPTEPTDADFMLASRLLIPRTAKDIAQLIAAYRVACERAAVERAGQEPAIIASQSEADAAWNDFCKRHLQPEVLFKVAQQMSEPTADQAKHLAECAKCREYIERYKVQPDPAMVQASREAYERGDYVTAEEFIERRRKAAQPDPSPSADAAQPDLPARAPSFSERNRRRCESPQGFNHALSSWSLSDWTTATTGEVGEAANIVKKLNRIRDGIPGNTETEAELRAKLADELADVACYLDLWAQAAGFDLETIRDAKFARVSAKMGYVEDVSQPDPAMVEAVTAELADTKHKLAELEGGSFSAQLAECVQQREEARAEVERLRKRVAELEGATQPTQTPPTTAGA